MSRFSAAWVGIFLFGAGSGALEAAEEASALKYVLADQQAGMEHRVGGDPNDDPDLPVSKDELFGLDSSDSSRGAPRLKAKSDPIRPEVKLRGFTQLESAYTYSSPTHWSRGVLRTQVEATGQLSGALKWKASARLDVDPVVGNSSFYPEQVKRDQRDDFFLRENYLDASLGNWEFRLGRQHIVWGEVVGLFFADVVSARDLRDYILPSFETIRIPQWAARAEYFASDFHLELAWIPVPSYDNIGKPGAEFYPLQIPPVTGIGQQVLAEKTPATTLSNTNYGLRASYLYKGWDAALFYYSSLSSSPTFYRELVNDPTPTLRFAPRHDRIWQAGATVSKDFGSVVLRGETVFTANRGYEVTRLSEADGVVKQDTLDYILSFDFVPFKDGRLNLQAFQRVYFGHDPDILYDRLETGVSVLISGKVHARWEPELLVIQSLNRDDRLLRPRVKWYPTQNSTILFGVDVFAGPRQGDFGRFHDRDRLYVEARYAF